MTPHGSDRTESDGEGDSQEMKTVWQHALELQAEMQLRTFQATLNMTLSGSRDS